MNDDKHNDVWVSCCHDGIAQNYATHPGYLRVNGANFEGPRRQMALHNKEKWPQ